ncbi:MAG: A/G-specific adenine glycosylase [Legionellaceae bacterium]|nr:A/G-specific adenine glycosylase [Legionellaceae bacterium]
MNRTTKIFTQTLLNWYERHGRKHFPWQNPRSDYRVWVSEIMLQQTQVKTVIPYFTRFIERFPDIQALANAAEDDVFSHWSGLGYYSRARNLHKTAKIIHTQYANRFPNDWEQLKSLPGIGPSTAAAIASLAYNQPTAILDGNVKRVLSRYFLIDGFSDQADVQRKLWQLANECMPHEHCADYTQAIMDMGATCCTGKNPSCAICPLQSSCLAYQTNDVANYPQKKPKTPRPTRFQQFLLLHTTERTIYLEKRPPTGIWGGLWCLPCIEMDDNPETYVQHHYNIQPTHVKKIMTMKHSFSHFHLHISVVSLQSKASGDAVIECSGRWFSDDELNKIGLAKPVTAIIDHFRIDGAEA